MSEMVERVANAIREAMLKQFDSGKGGPLDNEAYARAAIAAMREPTEAMIEAAEVSHDDRWVMIQNDEKQEVWRAMIDAALE